MCVFIGAEVVVKPSFMGCLPTSAQTAQKGTLWVGPCFQGNHAGIRSHKVPLFCAVLLDSDLWLLRAAILYV